MQHNQNISIKQKHTETETIDMWYGSSFVTFYNIKTWGLPYIVFQSLNTSSLSCGNFGNYGYGD